jgi:hypothetical protein
MIDAQLKEIILNFIHVIAYSHQGTGCRWTDEIFVHRTYFQGCMRKAVYGVYLFQFTLEKVEDGVGNDILLCILIACEHTRVHMSTHTATDQCLTWRSMLQIFRLLWNKLAWCLTHNRCSINIQVSLIFL